MWGQGDGEWPFEQRGSIGKDRLAAEQERIASASVWAGHRVKMEQATETSWRGGVGTGSEKVLGCLSLAQCRHLCTDWCKELAYSFGITKPPEDLMKATLSPDMYYHSLIFVIQLQGLQRHPLCLFVNHRLPNCS